MHPSNDKVSGFEIWHASELDAKDEGLSLRIWTGCMGMKRPEC